VAIPKEQLIEWKRCYGVIYQGEADGRDYCFRSLTVNEFNALSGGMVDDLAEQVDAEDTIVSTCLLYPSIEEYGSWPAGLAASLVDAIMVNSGWGDEEEISNRFAKYRGELGSYLNQFKMLIVAAGLGYTWEELDDKSVDKLLELTAAANEVLQIQASVAVGNPAQLDLGGTDENNQDPVAQKLYEASRKAGP
jgi:hypothetical protein